MWALLQRPRVRIEDADDTTVLHLTGRPRSAPLPSVDHVLADTPHRDVVLDLGELSPLDGAAWLWVLRLEERVRAWGRSFRLANGLGTPRARARPRSTLTGSPLQGSATGPRPFVNGRIPLRWYGSDERGTAPTTLRRRRPRSSRAFRQPRGANPSSTTSTTRSANPASSSPPNISRK